jgi:hypothetical protein
MIKSLHRLDWPNGLYCGKILLSFAATRIEINVNLTILFGFICRPNVVHSMAPAVEYPKLAFAKSLFVQLGTLWQVISYPGD